MYLCLWPEPIYLLVFNLYMMVLILDHVSRLCLINSLTFDSVEKDVDLTCCRIYFMNFVSSDIFDIVTSNFIIIIVLFDFNVGDLFLDILNS